MSILIMALETYLLCIAARVLLQYSEYELSFGMYSEHLSQSTVLTYFA